MRRFLKQARETKGLTVEEMSNRLDISVSFYYKIEQGIRNPTMKLAREISELLGHGVERLFFSHELDASSNVAPIKSTGTDGR